MPQNKKPSLYLYTLPAIIISTFLVLSLVFAWTEPGTAPPGGNVDAPLNIGNVTQYKSGALGIGGAFRGYSTAIFDGSVGIGTTAPADRLTIGGLNSNQLRLETEGQPSAYYTLFSSEWNYIKSFSIKASPGPIGDLAEIITWGGNSASGLKLGYEQTVMVLNNGNVGIGDTTPASLLTVGSGDLFQVDSEGNLVKIRNVTYSWPSSQGGANTFLRNAGDGTLSWEAAAGGIGYWTLSGSSLYPNQTSYNVGIGTTSPGTKLEISGDNNQLKLSTAGTWSSIYTYTGASNTGALIFSSNAAWLESRTGSLIFGTGGGMQERMRITSGGNVGIGTTGPQAKLAIGGTGGSSDIIAAYGNTTGSVIYAQQDNSNGYAIYASGKGYFTDNITVGSGDLFQVNSEGNLVKVRNVAYSWPSIQGGANTFLQNDGGGNLSWQAAAGGGIGGSGTANYISKFTAASTLGNSLIYDNGTNVGIGTTSPSRKLEVYGAGDTRIRASSDNSGDEWVGFELGGTANSFEGGLFHKQNDNNRVSIWSQNTEDFLFVWHTR